MASAKVPTLKVKAVATEEERKLQEKYRQLREKKKKLEEAKLAAGGAVEPAAEKTTEPAPEPPRPAAPDTAARPPVIGGTGSAFAPIGAGSGATVLPRLASGALPSSVAAPALPVLQRSAVPVLPVVTSKPKLVPEARKAPERVLKTKEEVAALLAQRRAATASAVAATQAGTGAAAAAVQGASRAAAGQQEVAPSAPTTAAAPAADEGGDEGGQAAGGTHRAVLKRPVRAGGADARPVAKRVKKQRAAGGDVQSEWAHVLATAGGGAVPPSGGGAGGAHAADDGLTTGGNAAAESLLSRRVFVSRLPPNADRHELLQSMARFGAVAEVTLDAGNSSGWVTFKDASVAGKVIEASQAFEDGIGAAVLVCEQPVLVVAATAQDGGPDRAPIGVDGAALYEAAWGAPTGAGADASGPPRIGQHHDVDSFYNVGGAQPASAAPAPEANRRIVSYDDL